MESNSVGIKHVPKEIENSLEIKTKTKIFRIQANNSIIYGYSCNGFIDFMLTGKALIDYTSFFSPFDFEKNYNIILRKNYNIILSYFENN